MLSIKNTYDGGVTDSRCDRHTILTAGAVPVFSGTACWSELVMSGRVSVEDLHRRCHYPYRSGTGGYVFASLPVISALNHRRDPSRWNIYGRGSVSTNAAHSEQ
jgi:hypothetical protein